MALVFIIIWSKDIIFSYIFLNFGNCNLKHSLNLIFDCFYRQQTARRKIDV